MTSKDPSVAKLFQILHSFTHQATSNTSNDLELIDDVSPLISVLQSSIKLEKQNEVLDCLGNIVADKDKEIEKICEQNYQEFIQSVDQLLLVKQSINSLRNNVTDLNRQIQSGGTQLLLTKMELIQQRKVQKNVDTAIETLKGCLNILKLANKVNLLLQSNKYYLALMTLEDLEQNHLPQTSQYEFTIYMSECIPHMRNSIKKAVVLDKREWLSSLRDRSRIIGKKKLNQMMKNFKRWGDRNKEGNSIAFHMVLDEDNESEGEEDDFEQIDQVIKFEPLFQCLHIHKILGILNEFQNSFCEDRQNHGISIISSDIKLESEHISNFDLFIYDITGFFLVEYCIMTTTEGFRMKSDVDILWDQMTSKLLNVISTNLSEANKDNTLHHVKDSLISMALLLEGYNYDIRQLKDFHSSLEFF